MERPSSVKVRVGHLDKKDVNTNDPVKIALMSRLQNFALAHAVESTSGAYVGPWNAFDV